MSTYINQYFIYGISVPYNWHKEWENNTGNDFHETFEEFMEDNHENVHCLFDGRDGRYLIIGKILEKTDKRQRLLGDDEPLVVPEISRRDKEKIKKNVKKYFGLTGEYNFYFVTHYK